jgi:hypothetical protein
VEVQGTTAGCLRVQVHLEGLSHRVGLDEVAFVMDVEAVLGGVVLEIGDESSDVDDCHWRSSMSTAACGSQEDTAIPVAVA